MRKALIVSASVAALLTLPSLASAQSNAPTDPVSGAVTGALGVVGAVVGGTVGAVVGPPADVDQPPSGAVVVEEPARQTQRTCIVENGVQRCREVIR